MNPYLMENPDEALRLDSKTDPEAVRERAKWCGIKPGLRILDVGCGSGRTASILHEMVQPGGELVGIDLSEERIGYAREKFGSKDGIKYTIHDFTAPMRGLGQFDLIWVQFVLEYFRKEASGIVENLTSLLKPDGYLCLLDLDYNCLSHHPISNPMRSVIEGITQELASKYNFDPDMGRKLYTFLYDLRFRDIEVSLMPHGLIYGNLQSKDHFNWTIKMEIAAKKAGALFSKYPGGKDAFFSDFLNFIEDPRRFSYNPLILAKGKKPDSVEDGSPSKGERQSQ